MFYGVKLEMSGKQYRVSPYKQTIGNFWQQPPIDHSLLPKRTGQWSALNKKSLILL